MSDELNELEKLIKMIKSNFDLNKLVTDDLTGLLKNDIFTQYTPALALQMITNKMNNDKPYSIMYCDINGLKAVNDDPSLGHDVADLGLKWIGSVIRDKIRTKEDREIVDILIRDQNLDDNIAIRVGGDEFVVILPHCSKEEALIVKNRIEDNIKLNSGLFFDMSISIGVADTNEIVIPNNFDINNPNPTHLNNFYSSLKRLAEIRMQNEKQQSKQNLSYEEKAKIIMEDLKKHANMLNMEFSDDYDLITLLEEYAKMGKDYFNGRQK